MKAALLLPFILFASTVSAQQYQIPGAQQQPAWVLPLYFEDAEGSRDTVYMGYDQSAETSAGWPLYPDTSFGEVYVPADTVGFRVLFGTNPWWFEADSVLKVLVRPYIGQLTVTLMQARLPLTMRWDSQLFYSDSLPFPDQNPLPRMEAVLWPAGLTANLNDPEGETCGPLEPIMLSDTSIIYPVCTFADSIVLDAWGCQGCLFTGDFDLWFREWSGGWVSVEELTDKNRIHLFPNPTTDMVRVQLPTATTASWELYDMQGKMVLHATFSRAPFTIDMGHLPLGVYLLRLSLSGQQVGADSHVYTRRIIRSEY